MKIERVILRWYKSFNVRYGRRFGVRGEQEVGPWRDFLSEEYTHDDFPFIEVPFENDITTIVGANESGKSHLLGAIHKVFTGRSIDKFTEDGFQEGESFAITDLCLYSPLISHNTDQWPNVGLEFSVSEEEQASLSGFLPQDSFYGAEEKRHKFTLVLGSRDNSAAAFILAPEAEPTEIAAEELLQLRARLPRVEFLHSNIALMDCVGIYDLLSAYGSSKQARGTDSNKSYFSSVAAQEAAKSVLEFLPGLSATQPLGADKYAKLESLGESLRARGDEVDTELQLEVLLFRDVMEVSAETLEKVASLGESKRSYVEGIVAKWNRRLEEELNLSRYWQQDDSFELTVNYKRDTIYFQITDKTQATYTFRDRSSGLRYFLSYYIQAKAIEKRQRGRGAVILMDEPDSFLSTVGQRNLLSVFEGLTEEDQENPACQLVYTTHSPFLINRNFPRRIRLVRKGDAEEGSQFFDSSGLRRYEPVRSALGIDCAHTLFMGATNLLLEGPTDQFLVAELIRHFVTKKSAGEFLDLNSIILSSADGASGIVKMVDASQWGDEPKPAIVALLDNDEAGGRERDRLTGVGDEKARLDPKFVVLANEVIDDFDSKHAIVSTEDILPRSIFSKGIRAYIKRWMPEVYESKSTEIDKKLKSAGFSRCGSALGAKSLFREVIFEESYRGYDKFGVLDEVIRSLPTLEEEERGVLRERVVRFCSALGDRIAEAERASRKVSGVQSVRRVVRDFQKTHRRVLTVFALQALSRRLTAEAEHLGLDSESMRRLLTAYDRELADMRSAGQTQLVGETRKFWEARLRAIQEDPIAPNDPTRDEANAEDSPAV